MIRLVCKDIIMMCVAIILRKCTQEMLTCRLTLDNENRSTTSMHKQRNTTDKKERKKATWTQKRASWIKWCPEQTEAARCFSTWVNGGSVFVWTSPLLDRTMQCAGEGCFVLLDGFRVIDQSGQSRDPCGSSWTPLHCGAHSRQDDASNCATWGAPPTLKWAVARVCICKKTGRWAVLAF